jgi:small subunit ribosomal protein S16
MVRIRLRRVGARSQPSYRIVATDRRSPRDGRFLEILGHYNPRTEPASVSVDEARLFHWLKNGAQPTDSVRSALNALGTWDRWTRYKAGEDLDTLVAEAEAAVVEVDPRTRRDDFSRSRPSKKTRAKENAPEPAEPEATKAEPETVAEAEAEAETVPEPDAVAESEPVAAEPEVSAEDGAETELTEPVAEAETPAAGDQAEPSEEETTAEPPAES